ncbi:MAG: superoxide dismutase family protein [Candidatus Neomarinimicrobiota bacterium]
MNGIKKLAVVCLLGSVKALGLGDSSLYVAHAAIHGAERSGVSGKATFIQTGTGILGTVLVVVEVKGLQPGSIHGCHIHETGTCDPDFKAAGGHFDPGPYGMSNPDANHPFHMGDLPNLVADGNGVAVLEHRTSRITLSPGPLSLFDKDGSAIIVHVNPDKGTTGATGGAGGGRLACGVIAPD